MSRSHRKSLRPDPTVSPNRNPFSPSYYQKKRAELAAAARRLNRNFGHRLHGAGARQIGAASDLADGALVSHPMTGAATVRP